MIKLETMCTCGHPYYDHHGNEKNKIKKCSGHELKNGRYGRCSCEGFKERTGPLLKKTITYEDFNGEKVSEDFFFHLSKAELVELELSHQGGLSESLQRIVAAEDGKSIVAEFKNIILTSYGKRSDDGKRFIKNKDLREEFESTEAYSALFMELVTNTDAAVEFIQGIIPQDMSEEATKLAATQAIAAVPEAPKPTAEELMGLMTEEERQKLKEKLSE